VGAQLQEANNATTYEEQVLTPIGAKAVEKGVIEKMPTAAEKAAAERATSEKQMRDQLQKEMSLSRSVKTFEGPASVRRYYLG
jgi:hypothetical protein